MRGERGARPPRRAAQSIKEEIRIICVECGGEMVPSTEPLTESYKGMDVTVEGLEYHICPDCGETVMSGDMADRQAREMARLRAEPPHGLAG